MTEGRVISVAKELKGMSALATDSGERIGEVVDAIIHPIEGRVLGLSLLTNRNERRALAARDLFIGEHAVMVSVGAHLEDSLTGLLAGGAHALGEIVGTHIVTQDGRVVGRVSEVFIDTLVPHSYYRVTESALQRLFKGGYFISSDVVKAYSSDHTRMIVPVDIEDRYAFHSLAELLERDRPARHPRTAGM